MTNIGFIGAGNMAEAIISGILKNGIFESENIVVFDISKDRSDYMSERYKIKTLDSEEKILQESDYTFLAVKPQVFPSLRESGFGLNYQGTIISIMAGVDLSSLKIAFPKAEVVRTMPNFPALVGEGMTGLCFSNSISKEKKDVVVNIFDSIGKTLILEEKNIDALTGLSGSGPAFVFQFAEALADAGVYCGLPRKDAYLLAAQTIYGSAKMIMETGNHPGDLKDSVTSPGGTTIEGIKNLEKNGFRNAVMEAVIGSYKKSKELK